MPQYTNAEKVNHLHPYCNDFIFHLVRSGLLSVKIGLRITSEQYEASALSDQHVQDFVNQRKISAIVALRCSLLEYQRSALSYHRIQILVECDIMPAQRALSICRAEVENPVTYLTALGDDRTPEQTRKLQLYECDRTITSDFVEHIVMLEFMRRERRPSEERELSLLLDPGLRKYAVHIVNLEFFVEETEETKRELELLFSRYSRDYANLILDLEFKENKSDDDEIYLENLYLRVCCRLPKKNPIFTLFQSVLQEELGIDSAAGPQGCHFQASHGGLGFELCQHDASERRLMEQMKTTIEVAAKEIVMVQLDVRGVSSKLREMDAMRNYILIKTDFLRHILMKYFVGAEIPYSKAELDAVVEKISQRLRDKTLTLSDTEQLLAIRYWVDEEVGFNHAA